MKDLFSKLGKTLTKAEQKQINGGAADGERSCSTSEDCRFFECCAGNSCIDKSRPACEM